MYVSALFNSEALEPHLFRTSMWFTALNMGIPEQNETTPVSGRKTENAAQAPALEAKSLRFPTACADDFSFDSLAFWVADTKDRKHHAVASNNSWIGRSLAGLLHAH